jgi:hypothetical protein
MNPDRAADDRFPDAVLVLSALPAFLRALRGKIASRRIIAVKPETAIRASDARISN